MRIWSYIGKSSRDRVEAEGELTTGKRETGSGKREKEKGERGNRRKGNGKRRKGEPEKGRSCKGSAVILSEAKNLKGTS